MKAMVLNKICDLDHNYFPLKLTEVKKPDPAENEILIKISCCGVCHTELDEIEGRTAPSEFPIILGHEVVGTVEAQGASAKRFSITSPAAILLATSSDKIFIFPIFSSSNYLWKLIILKIKFNYL